jgi:two-component system sensor histidine kinase BaeS
MRLGMTGKMVSVLLLSSSLLVAAMAPATPATFIPPFPDISLAAPTRPFAVYPRALPPPPNDRTGLSTRLRLLDSNRLNIIGPPDTTGSPITRSIKIDEEIVGWLSLTPQQIPSSDLDRSFRDEQLNAIYPIAIGAQLLALLVGVPLGGLHDG